MRRVNSGGAHDDHPREAPALHAQTAPSSRIATTIACTPRFQDMHSLPFLWLRGSEYLLVPGAATGALRAFRDSDTPSRRRSIPEPCASTPPVVCNVELRPRVWCMTFRW